MCYTDKGIVFFAAVNSLIQSSVCVAFAVVVIFMHQCILVPNPPQSVNPNIPGPLTTFSNTFYLQYFHSQNNCIAHKVDFWKDINDTRTGVVTKSYQVQGMFIGYLVDNGIWLIASCLLLVGACLHSKWIYILHSFSSFLVMIYDVILVVIFSLDFKSYKEFLGNPNTPWITKNAMLVNIIVMILIVSRFIVFFIINLTFFCLILRTLGSMGRPSVPTFDPKLPIKSKKPPPPSVNVLTQSPTKPYHDRQSTAGNQQKRQQQQVRRYPDVVSHPGEHFDDSDETNIPQTHGGGKRSSVQASQSSRGGREMRTDRQQVSAVTRSPGRMSRNYEPLSPSPDGRRTERSPPNKLQHRYPTGDHDSSNSSYDGKEYSASPHKTSANRERRDRTQRQTSSEEDSTAETRYAAIVRRDTSKRPGSEQLKNQRPWSYINPNELPSSANKMNQYFTDMAKNQPTSASARALSSLIDDEEDYQPERHHYARPTPINRQMTREYQSMEFEQPLLSRPVPAPDRVYANLQQPKKRKNVRFDQRAQSLDYLETSFPSDSPVEARKSGLKSPKSQPKKPPRPNKNKTTHGSGEELCTDEFVIRYHGSPSKAPKPSVPLKRTPSSVSSPNLVFDPTSNTVRLVYDDERETPPKPKAPCRRQGTLLIHVPPCDGISCLVIHRNETSL